MTLTPRGRPLLALVLALAFALATPPPAPAQVVEHGGILQDSRTGLIWVADADHAVTSGFARSMVMSRERALEFIAAMNSGRIENFGYSDWRLPTEAELAHFLRFDRSNLQKALSFTPRRGGWVVAWPVKASGVEPGFTDAAIVATNSVHIDLGADITGNVVVNEPSPGPTLDPGNELRIAKNGNVAGDVAAETVQIEKDATVTGDVAADQLQNKGTIGGAVVDYVPPVFASLPAFASQAPAAGSPDVTVATGETVEIDAGDYGDLVVADGGTLSFSGGTYNVRSISTSDGGGGCPFPCRSFLFRGDSEVRVEGRVNLAKDSFLGPAGGSVTAADVILYVAGQNGVDGALGSEPEALRIGHDSTVAANLYAPNGTVRLHAGTRLTGAAIGRDVDVDKESTVAVLSFFRNELPTADPQEVFTDGGGTITITLTGSDPDGDDLTFSIVTNPTQGVLGPVIQDPPPFPGNPPGCNPANDPLCIPGDPPRTSATVDYTPNTGDDLEDSFTFQVADGSGGIGVAVVTINPPPEVNDPPNDPIAVVTARDRTAATTTDVPVVITLRADAPCDPTDAQNPVEPCDGVGNDIPLTFAIVTGPSNGVLSSLTQGSAVPQRTARVTYTPDAGFSSPPDDSFVFEACGLDDGAPVCDQGTVTINVVAAQASADDQQVSTPEDTAVTIALSGSPGFPGGEKAAKVAFLHPVAVAGNVADTDVLNPGGENHNDLPGPVPVLMAAAVNSTGGPGSNGLVRMHFEWDLRPLAGIASEITGAEVVLSTEVGTVDSLDTEFFLGTFLADFLLDDSDFNNAGVPVSGVVMEVPDVPVGTQGTFSFDVTSEVTDALLVGRPSLTLQGRVANEVTTGAFARGLQVRTSADGNIAGGSEPQLSITTSGLARPLVFSIVSLPTNGTLADTFAGAVSTVPTTLVRPSVVYAPNASFTGSDTFQFEVDNGVTTAIGTVTVNVGPSEPGDCEDDEEGCDDGR